MKILIVDDQPKKRLNEALRQLPGTFVKECHNLDKALSYVFENPWSIDLILVDKVFTNVVEGDKIDSGLALGSAVSQQYPFIPMAMFTANDHTPETTKAALKKCGFIDFFNKSDLTDRTISTILNQLKEDPIYIEKINQRKRTKKRTTSAFLRRPKRWC